MCILGYSDKNGVKKIYALMSGGASTTFLDTQWNELDMNYSGNIDIIVGSCRTKSNTPAWWNTKSDSLGFNRIWFDSNDKFSKAINPSVSRI